MNVNVNIQPIGHTTNLLPLTNLRYHFCVSLNRQPHSGTSTKDPWYIENNRLEKFR